MTAGQTGVDVGMPSSEEPTHRFQPEGSVARRRHAKRDRWLGVDLRHLAALAAVAEERSFSAAADRLGYVQSAVSQQILHLEKVVGTRLVARSRGPQPVSLTDAGEILLSHVQSILSRLRVAQHEIDQLVAAQTRTLRIGVDHELSSWLLPRLLQGIGAHAPDLNVVTSESGSDAELFGALERAEIDAAFASLPAPAGPFDSEALLADPYYLVVGANSRLASRMELELDELAGEPLIGRRHGRSIPQVELDLIERGIQPDIVFRSNVTATIQALVASGLGAAVLPRLTIDGDDPGTAIVPLPGLQPRVAGVHWLRAREDDASLEALRAAARRVAAELTREIPTATAC